jgi:hypothetical protein
MVTSHKTKTADKYSVGIGIAPANNQISQVELYLAHGFPQTYTAPKVSVGN